MDSEKIQELYTRLRPHLLQVFLAGLGLILLISGAVVSISSKKSEEITFTPASDQKENNSAISSGNKILVDIEGAVLRPGVYSLDEGSRIKDALIATGGLSASADRNWVDKNLNLASKLSDSAKIYVPKIGETVGNQESGTKNRGLVNINSASVGELDSLPSIGLATAQKIIDGRPYASINDLLSKKIVSQKTFDKIKLLISY